VKVKRGEIWNIQFPLPERENSEPDGHGCVVIVSSDAFNQSAIRTVIVAVVTSNLKLARAPGNLIVLADDVSGLRTILWRTSRKFWWWTNRA
jgi:mRNA interferase MazF